ncbi:MAG: polysaccharide deacetylase family protein [Pyrinomonadaceae bacterium]|nr:polysaccharide deacetylase family protein [Pyrinomonadaceae bacterium]
MRAIGFACVCALLAQLPAATQARDCVDDASTSGITRTIAIEQNDGARFGKLQYSQTAPLRDKEVVLTFDDGPLPAHTGKVLDVLDRYCVKATFFAVGRMALFNAPTLKSIARRGHTIATHTWSHQRDIGKIPYEEAKLEIEKGFAAVSYALGAPIAPFFRYPGLNDSPQLNAYMAARNISVWSVDVVSGDTTADMTPERLVDDTMNRLRRMGRGIILFHDIKKVTADGLETFLIRLRAEGYKVVHVVSNTAYLPDVELLAKINFGDSIRTVAFTGRPVGGTEPLDLSKMGGSVDYARTERVFVNGALHKGSPRLNNTTASKRFPVKPNLAEGVTGNQLLLSGEAAAETGSIQPKTKPR